MTQQPFTVVRGIVQGPEPEFDGPGTAVADLLKDMPKAPVVPTVIAQPQLENIVGNLLYAYCLTVPGTMLHSDQLMNAHRLNPITPQGKDLQKLVFYTADGIIYFLDGKIPKLAITREADNLVLRHLDDIVNSSFEQLAQAKNYRPDPAEADRAIHSSTTEIFDLTQLGLKKHDDELSYLAISLTDYKKLNPEQRRLAERVYGQSNDFIANMAMLATANITKTKIFVLNPVYIKKEAVNGYLGRASWLSFFDYKSYFVADNRGIDSYGRLRGVRRVIAVGGALQNGQVSSAPSAQLNYETAFQLVTQHPELLDKKRAAELSKIVTAYLLK